MACESANDTVLSKLFTFKRQFWKLSKSISAFKLYTDILQATFIGHSSGLIMRFRTTVSEVVSEAYKYYFSYQEVYNKIQHQMDYQKFLRLSHLTTSFASDDIFYEDEDFSQALQPLRSHALKEKVILDEPLNVQMLDDSSAQKRSKEPSDGRKCLNHNFQKHAVTTVKKLMRMKYSSHGLPQEKLAFKIWNIFMISDVKSKKLLVVLFGTIKLSDPRDQQLFRKCGFEEILSQEQSLIRMAQEILRNRFVETVTEQLVWENLKNFRSIKQSQEFYVYFTELLRLIRAGPLVKLRINERTSRKIRDEISCKQIL